MESRKNRFDFSVLLRNIGIYVLVVAVVYYLLMGIKEQIYDITYSSIADDCNKRITDGAFRFDKSIETMMTSVLMLEDDENFIKLARAGEEAGVEQSVTLNLIKSKLTNLITINGDSIECICLEFPENRMFISNYCIGLNDVNAYPRMFKVDGLTLDEWRSSIFSQAERLSIGSSQTIKKGYEQESVKCIPCVIIAPTLDWRLAKGAAVFYINEARVAESFINDFEMSDVSIILTDKHGKQILEYGNRTSDDVLEFGDTQSSAYINVHVAISKTVLSERIYSITRLIRMYLYFGILGVLVMIGFYVLQYTLHEYRLIRLAKTYTEKPYRRINTVNYLEETIRTIKETSNISEQKLLLLKNEWFTELLRNACIYGVLTQNDSVKIKEILQDLDNRFCVMIITAQNENELMWAEESLHAISSEPKVVFYAKHDEIVCVCSSVCIDDNETAQRLAEQLWSSASIHSKYTIGIGISEVGNDIEKLSALYEEARLALKLRDSVSQNSGVCVYGRDVVGLNEPCISMNLLNKLTDLLLTGDAEQIATVFEEINELMLSENINSIRYMYSFSTLRMAILNASRAIVKDATFDIPQYRADEDFKTALSKLNECCIKLCKIVENRKKSNNQQLFDNIINYINLNYQNPNLNADMIAHEFKISPTYVLQFVKMQTSKSLNDYIEEVRIDSAERYLLNTDWEIGRILEEVGYCSTNTMYRAFRRRHGVTPGTWRKQKTGMDIQ